MQYSAHQHQHQRWTDLFVRLFPTTAYQPLQYHLKHEIVYNFCNWIISTRFPSNEHISPFFTALIRINAKADSQIRGQYVVHFPFTASVVECSSIASVVQFSDKIHILGVIARCL